MVSDSTLHALIGAVVTVVFSFVPFSPVLGGGVAAYLNDADTSDGVRIGALSGLLATIPLLLLGFLAFAIFGIFAVSGPVAAVWVSASAASSSSSSSAPSPSPTPSV